MTTEVMIHFPTQKATKLQQFGDYLQKNQAKIQILQWSIVVFYLTLLIWPAFLPLPKDYVHFYQNLVLFAQFVFWGIWWPFVMLSMFLVGRLWCGLFCPEGFLTELASQHGLGKKIPHWIRWGGWPFAAFVVTTIYGQLISVYEYPKAALLILGGSTIAAIIIGYIYGRGKRVWCRYLCPANGVFSLLARLAPVTYQVNPDAWKSAQKPKHAVNCAPLVSISHMTGNSNCHMCGRCSGHRHAVTLSERSVNKEILSLTEKNANPWDILLLFFGMLGVATGAFQWSASPWFIDIKQSLAEYFINRDSYWILNNDIPWWLLTHYPETNDVFSWLDGVSILIYITLSSFIIGGCMLLALYLSGKIVRYPSIPWHLAYSFIPLAGISLFLGLSSLTLAMLKAEHWLIPGIAPLRAVLLGLGLFWSLWLLWKKLSDYDLSQKSLVCLIMGSSSLLIIASWIFMFFLW